MKIKKQKVKNQKSGKACALALAKLAEWHHGYEATYGHPTDHQPRRI